MTVDQQPPSSHPQNTEPLYSQKTQRLSAYSSLLRAVSITSFTAAVLVLLGSAIGSCHKTASRQARPVTKNVPVRPAIPYDQINKEIINAVAAAKTKAMAAAAVELDAWVSELMKKADDDFADWYFGYWNQQGLALNFAVDSLSGDANEKLAEKIQKEFSSRVLSPQIAALRYQRIVDNAVNVYVADVRKSISAIPVKYDIPAADFDRYLADAGQMLKDINGNRSVPLTLKSLSLPVAYGGVLTTKLLYDFTRKIVARVSARLGAQCAETAAARAGTAAAETAAGWAARCVVPLLTVGFVAWEYYDHTSTVKEQKPILLRNIRELLNELRETLLNDPQSGVKGVLAGFEDSILRSLPAKPMQQG